MAPKLAAAAAPKRAVGATKKPAAAPKKAAPSALRELAPRKRVRQERAEPEGAGTIKVRREDVPKPIIVEVVLMSGERVAQMNVQTSQTVQEVLDQVSAQVPFDDCVGHLTHQCTQLLPHKSLGEAGVQDGAMLTLTFEAKPLRLRSVARTLTHAQAWAEELRLQPELERHDDDVAAAAALVEERQRERRTLQTELSKLMAKVRKSDQECLDAQQQLDEAHAARCSAADKLLIARQDKRNDFDRVMERLDSLIERLQGYSSGDMVALDMVLDLRDLHLAGQVCDDELVSAVETVATSSLSAFVKAECLYAFMERASAEPGHLRVIEALLPPIVASDTIQGGTCHRALKWKEIARAIGLSDRAAAVAAPFADSVVRLSRRFAIVTADGMGLATHVGMGASRQTTSMQCILQSVIYPVLLLLRRASLPAATVVEAEIRARLLDAARWSSIDWAKLAADTCHAKDAAFAENFADGLIAHVRAERVSRRKPGDHRSPHEQLYSELGSSADCPLLCKLHPALQSFEAAAFPAAGKLRAALIELLQPAAVEHVPDQPDFSMQAEAEIVGTSHPGLRDFLLSTRIEETFDTTKIGRLEIHRLIDNRIPGGSRQLSHESSGYGSSRHLVVRKRFAVRERQRLSALRELRAEHCRLLESMATHAGS